MADQYDEMAREAVDGASRDGSARLYAVIAAALRAAAQAERERADKAERARDEARAALAAYHHTSPDEPASWSQAVRDAVRVMVEQAREEERERIAAGLRERAEEERKRADALDARAAAAESVDVRDVLGAVADQHSHTVLVLLAEADRLSSPAVSRATRATLDASVCIETDDELLTAPHPADCACPVCEDDRLTSAPAAPRVEAQLQTACETLERVACALTDIDPVHPALSGARAVLESCEWTPGGKVGARQRFLDRVDAAGEPPSSILAGRVEAQGEAVLYDVWCDGRCHYTRPEGDPLLDEARARPGYTVVRRGGPQP